MKQDSAAVFSLFLVAWVVGVGAWFFLIVETVAAWRLAPWVFRIGLPIVRRVVALPAPYLPSTEEPFAIGDAKLRWIGPQECIFRRQFHFFRFALRTPIPVNCTLRWDGPHAVFTARTPLGAIVFLAAWLVGWTVAGLGSPSTDPSLGRTGFLLFGWGIAATMTLVSVVVERRRAEKLLDEVGEHVRKSSRLTSA